VLAVFFEGDREQDSAPIDLSSDPVKLAEKWLEVRSKQVESPRRRLCGDFHVID
jgi:hypothetical protein